MALEAWARAGLRAGQSVIDAGCGPGFASFDLAEIVGSRGRVIGIDRSETYAEATRAGAAARGLAQLSVHLADLLTDPLPRCSVDLVWMRWVASFLPNVDAIVGRLAPCLAPGGRLIAQEYLDRGTLRLIPADQAFDRFAEAICTSWSATGGNPEAGRHIPAACERAGLTIEALVPRVLVVRPVDPGWDWVAAFLETGPARLVELGFLTPSDGAAAEAAWARACDNPSSMVVTSTVIEVHAKKGIR